MDMEKYYDTLKNVFGDYVDWLRNSQGHDGGGVATFLMRRFAKYFPELHYLDWVELLNLYYSKYNPKPPAQLTYISLVDGMERDRVLRKVLFPAPEKSPKKKKSAPSADSSDFVQESFF